MSSKFLLFFTFTTMLFLPGFQLFTCLVNETKITGRTRNEIDTIQVLNRNRIFGEENFVLLTGLKDTLKTNRGRIILKRKIASYRRIKSEKQAVKANKCYDQNFTNDRREPSRKSKKFLIIKFIGEVRRIRENVQPL